MRNAKRETRRPGAVLPLVTICLIALLGFIALAIDVGMMAVARSQSQNAADVAALAGARTLNGKDVNNNKVNAEKEAKEAAQANEILTTPISASQIDLVNTGIYKYNTTSNRFQADFTSAPTGTEAYGAMRVRIKSVQPTFFGRVLGMQGMEVSAVATAVHRPRDIAISLDMSGSMKFSSEYNWPPISGSTLTSGTLSPDPRFPRFGPWKIFPLASGSTWNPMQRLTSYIDSGGETHAPSNMTLTTDNGPPLVNNFQVAAGAGAQNAFVYNNELSGASFNINNAPICTPVPLAWESQYASGYAGDRFPLKWGVSGSSPAAGDYAKTAGEMVNITPVSTSSRNATFETSGYDWTSLTFRNGTFKGYSMAPGYYGKTFYMWPPDPRYTAGADPLNILASDPIKDNTGKVMADWRKRFFLNPGASAGSKGTPLSDNSRLWTTAGVWQTQNLGSTLRYIPNYDAILAWLKNGPKVLPNSVRAGRVLYYNSIPTTIPIDWSTGLLNGSPNDDQRFWKGYIDFVIGCGEHNRGQTLCGVGTNNTWAGSTYGGSGANKITPEANLTGTTKPYMAYDDNPIHPRGHMWFGPQSMLAYFSMNSNNRDYNWYAGTTYEAQTWQLKAGVQSAFDDIKKNHPNDLASLNFWSSVNGYATVRVAMGKDYDKMKSCLFYPFSLLGSLGTVGSEKRPYSSTTPSNTYPSGISVDNYSGDIPLGSGGTNPSMGLMTSYNQFNYNGGFTGRKGATKIVILETDGVANQEINGTFTSMGSGTYKWASVTNGGDASTTQANGHPDALNPAVSLAWVIAQDATGSKPFPVLPGYSSGSGMANAPAPTKWSGIPNNAPGFSTTRSPARVHTLAFGYLFEDATTSPLKTRALQFLRNMQMATGLAQDASTGTIEDYKRIVGTYDERIAKIREAFERIMQNGIQVALIE